MPRGAIRNDRARELQGQRAGFVSRAAAGAIDIAAIFGMYVLVLFVVGLLRFLLTEEPLKLPRPDLIVTIILFNLLGVVMFSTAWSGSGRTIGDDIVGLRVVTATGDDVTSGRALARALILAVTVGLALVPAIWSKRNNGLHDWLCRTTVVYAWRPRSLESRPHE